MEENKKEVEVSLPRAIMGNVVLFSQDGGKTYNLGVVIAAHINLVDVLEWEYEVRVEGQHEGVFIVKDSEVDMVLAARGAGGIVSKEVS